MKAEFERIYEHQAWGKGKGSGTGSNPIYCAAYLTYLRELLPRYRCVLDIGCGDWQLYTGFKWPKTVRYIGVDIVRSNIDRNELVHASSNITFHCTDACNPAMLHVLFEQYSPQLVLIKDVMQHWSNDEVAKWLRAMKHLPWQTIISVNNWKHFRSPAKNKQPRDINNRHRWAPIDMRKYGFKDVLYYPRGKFKQVARLDNLGDII